MSYRVDLGIRGPIAPVPSTFVNSVHVPGKIVAVNEDGSSVVVLPDGTERATGEPADSPNFDSPWTQATPFGTRLIYRSPGGPTAPTPAQVLGVPRIYEMIV